MTPDLRQAPRSPSDPGPARSAVIRSRTGGAPARGAAPGGIAIRVRPGDSAAAHRPDNPDAVHTALDDCLPPGMDLS